MLHLLNLVGALCIAASAPSGCGPSEQPLAGQPNLPREAEVAAAAEAVVPVESPRQEVQGNGDAAVAMDPPEQADDPPEDPPTDEPDPVSSSWAVDNADGTTSEENLLLLTPLNLVAAEVGDEESVRLRWSVQSANQLAFLIERQHWWGEQWIDSELIVVPPFPYVHTDAPGAGLWRYRIAAADQDGTSDPSGWSEVRVNSSWTTFTPSADTKIVYVSSSEGSDSNDGLSPFTPKATIAGGYALLRNGYPDWLLLKRGDVWTVASTAITLTKSGRSESELQLIGCYGNALARPHIITGTSSGIGRGGASTITIDFVAVVGLHFDGGQRTATGGSGISFIGRGSYLLFEGNYVEGYKDNFNLQRYDGASLTDVCLRRNLILDSWSVGSHSQGIYASDISGLVIEENVFDHNGWNDAISGADKTVYNHNLYLQPSNTGVIVRGNIVARGAATGIQLRGSGILEDNFVIENPLGITLGHGQAPAPNNYICIARNNVIYDGSDIGAAPRAYAFAATNCQEATFVGNLILNNTSSTSAGLTWWIEAAGMGVARLTIESNLAHSWGGPIQLGSNSVQLPNITIASNVLIGGPRGTLLVDHLQSSTTGTVHSANNVLFSGAPASSWARVAGISTSLSSWQSQVSDTTSQAGVPVFNDASSTIEAYANAIGVGTSRADFYLALRQQSPWNWNSRLAAGDINSYFRDGFLILSGP